MIRARKSHDRKHIVCGACLQPIARRESRAMPGGPVRLEAGRRVAGRQTQHVIVWGDGWHVVDDHIEMSDSALDRLLAGREPGRKAWLNAERLTLSRAVRAAVPALCPWCPTLNEINWKSLDVDGIAAY